MALADNDNLRKWLGIAIVASLLITAVALLVIRSNRIGKPEQLADEVVIKDSVSGEEWRMARGRLLNSARAMSAEGTLKPDVGLPNPKTGKRTGFPLDRREWEAIVQQMNAEREADNRARGIANPGS